ncbi:hypothetical protein AB0L97_33025 [Nocardia sp. NPDC051911]|uniref:hypothetical protein n=1 Tax=Nocardia sp. NPDC051911 TaxID=3154648 RepID=UPI00341466C0
MAQIWQCPLCPTAITYEPGDNGADEWTCGYIAGHERGHDVHMFTGHNPRTPSLPLQAQPKGDNT